jgi:hypothetical protein
VISPFWDPGNEEGYIEHFELSEGSPWDLGYLDGVLIPGKVAIGDGSITRKIDVQNGPGIDGATMKFQSVDPGDLSIVVVIWTPDQWRAWQAFNESFLPKSGKKPPRAYSFYHPATAAIGIFQIVSETVGVPRFDEGKRLVSITIKARQYLKPKKAQVLPAVSIKADTVAPTQNDAPSATKAGP